MSVERQRKKRKVASTPSLPPPPPSPSLCNSDVSHSYASSASDAPSTASTLAIEEKVTLHYHGMYNRCMRALASHTEGKLLLDTTYERLRLTQNEWQQLAPEGWIGDIIMYAAMRYLNRRYPRVLGIDSIAFANFIAHECGPNNRQATDGHDEYFIEKRLVFFPHFEANHWTVVIADFRQCQFAYYDPKHSSAGFKERIDEAKRFLEADIQARADRVSLPLKYRSIQQWPEVHYCHP